MAFDLGNSVLLGIGRYHTGLETTISSRYQYSSLLSTLPLAGFWITRQFERLPARWFLPRIAAASLLLATTWIVTRGWTQELRPFAFARGTESRRILLHESNPGPNAVPGIDFLPTERARQLIRQYNLH
ncbi:MAG: hypothetical protein PHQ04_02125 [Opitutaceae bacterium]|nr:hypothetical protein [Opitutaceae bacterium]